MEPLRIVLIVSPWYPVPPRGYGGIELMAYYLARELSQRGHSVTVIGRQGSQGPFETLALAPESWSRQLGTRDQIPRYNLFLYRAYEIVRKRAFDVIHDHTSLGPAFAGLLRDGPPVVHTLHGPWTSGLRNKLALVQDCVHLVAISHAQAAVNLDVAYAAVVHNGVDTALFRPRDKDEARRRLGIEAGAPVVLFAGNLVAIKGPDLFLETVGKMRQDGREVRAVFVGHGPLLGRLRARADALGLSGSVRFAGAPKELRGRRGGVVAGGD